VTSVLLFGVPAHARESAETPSLRIEVDCAALDPRDLPELETRARADLDAAGIGSGTLRIFCEPSAVTVSLARSAGPPLVAAREGAPNVERIFQAVTELAAAAQETEKPAPPAPPMPKRPPEARLRAPLDAPARRERPRALSVLAGPSLLVWSAAAPIAAGVEAGALATAPPFSVELGGGIFWNTTTGPGVSARLGRATLRLRFTLTTAPELELAGGPLLESLWVKVRGTATPSNRAAVLYGAVLEPAFVHRFSSTIFVRASPELTPHLRDARIELDGRELFRVPRVVPGASLRLGAAF
jgi:hypothetical protein